MRLLWVVGLWSLFLAWTNTINLSPQVTRICREIHPPVGHFPPALKAFEDSKILLLLMNDVLQISFDNWRRWQDVEEIGGSIAHFWEDGKERAFAESRNYDLYIT